MPSQEPALEVSIDQASLEEVKAWMSAQPSGSDVFYQQLEPVKLLAVRHGRRTTDKGTELETVTLEVSAGSFKVNVIQSKPFRPGAHRHPLADLQVGSYLEIRCVRVQVVDGGITCWLDGLASVGVLAGYTPPAGDTFSQFLSANVL